MKLDERTWPTTIVWWCVVLLVAGARAAGAAEPERDPIEGTWTGTVTGPQGPTAIGLGFARGEAGALVLTLDFPAMHTHSAKLGVPVEAHDPRYAIPAFQIELTRSGDRLSGTFAAARLPLELRRGGSFAPPPAPPVHPAAPPPRFSRELGPTWATPVVADGTLYVGTEAGRFFAVNAADGVVRWSADVGARIDGRPVVAGERVCFVDGAVRLTCVSRADGALVWREPLHDIAIAGGPPTDNPTFNRRTATPLVIGSEILAGSSDGGLYAFDLANGVRRWRFDAGSPIFSGITEIDDHTLALGTMSGAVVLVDRVSHREVGRLPTGGGVVTTPVLARGRLVVGSRDYLLYGFDLASRSPAWRFSYWFSWVESTPALDAGELYVGGSDYRRVTALDPVSGQVRWSTDVLGLAWGTPAVTADRVFIGTVAQNLEGTLIEHQGGVVALDRASGAVVWRYASPAPAEGAFGGFAGSLAVDDRSVFAIGFEGRLLAFPVTGRGSGSPTS